MQHLLLELDAGDTAASIACFEKMNSIKPLDMLAQACYGTALFRSGKIDESLAVLEKAAASTPLVAEALNAVGVVYYTKKRTEDAIAAFKSAVETDSELLEIRYNLAVAELAHRNRAAATSQYIFIKSENPRLADQLYRMLYGDKLLNASEKKTTKH